MIGCHYSAAVHWMLRVGEEIVSSTGVAAAAQQGDQGTGCHCHLCHLQLSLSCAIVRAITARIGFSFSLVAPSNCYMYQHDIFRFHHLPLICSHLHRLTGDLTILLYHWRQFIALPVLGTKFKGISESYHWCLATVENCANDPDIGEESQHFVCHQNKR